jgi:hypothetical protein
LHSRFFDECALEIFQGISIAISPAVTVILDLGGVAGTTGLRQNGMPGVTDSGPIDVHDTAFREASWVQWQHQDDPCSLCMQEVSTKVSTSISTLMLAARAIFPLPLRVHGTPSLSGDTFPARLSPHPSDFRHLSGLRGPPRVGRSHARQLWPKSAGTEGARTRG